MIIWPDPWDDRINGMGNIPDSSHGSLWGIDMLSVFGGYFIGLGWVVG